MDLLEEVGEDASGDLPLQQLRELAVRKVRNHCVFAREMLGTLLLQPTATEIHPLSRFYSIGFVDRRQIHIFLPGRFAIVGYSSCSNEAVLFGSADTCPASEQFAAAGTTYCN